MRICSRIVGSTVGDLGESIGVSPNGQPVIDSRTQQFLKVPILHELYLGDLVEGFSKRLTSEI